MINKIKKSLLLGILTTSIIGPASSLVNFEIDRDLQKMSDPTISLTEKIKHLNTSQLSQAIDFDSNLSAQTNNTLAHNLKELNNAILKLINNQEQLNQKISGYSAIIDNLVSDLDTLKNIPIIENMLTKYQGALAQVNSGSFEPPFNLRNIENDGKEKVRAPYPIDGERIENSEGIFGKNPGKNNNDQFDSLINKTPAPPPPAPPPPPFAGKIPAPPPPPGPGVSKNKPAAVKAASNKKPPNMMSELGDKIKNLGASKNTAAKKEREDIAKKAVLLMRNDVQLNSRSDDIKEALKKIMPDDLNTVTADESAAISGDLNLFNRWQKLILGDQEQGNSLKNKLRDNPINKQVQDIDLNEKNRNNLMSNLNVENPLSRLKSVKDNPRPDRSNPGDSPEKKELGGLKVYKMGMNTPTTLFTIQNSLEENKIKLKKSTDKKNSLTSKAEDALEKGALLRIIGNLNDTIRYQENKLEIEIKQRLSVLLEMGFNKDNVSDENIKSITAEQLRNAQIDNISDDMAAEWTDKIIQAFKPN